MQKIILENWRNHFIIKKTIGCFSNLNYLAEFLSDSGDLEWKDWIYNNPNNACISGNAAGICINDESNIEIFGEVIFDEVPPFVVSKEKFIQLLKVWQQIYRLKPQILELTQDDEDRIIFEYDTPEGHQKIIIE